MLSKLKKEVLDANLQLVDHNLVVFTWGNASAIDRSQNLVVIKPSGIGYSKMKAVDLVVLDLEGNVVEGSLKPSSDTPTHLYLYNVFPEIGGVVHTHSEWATIWAQAGRGIPALGTTHADYFNGTIPCTRPLTKSEIKSNYEINTGQVIVETFSDKRYQDIPGVLVHNHGPFCWGKNAKEAVQNAVILEQIAKIAYRTLLVNPEAELNPDLLKKHFSRKHGPDSYYGQGKGDE
jgi:L-ribulose-5-phosphate 4-epimerase